MMPYRWETKIPTSAGSYTKTFYVEDPANHLYTKYQHNRYNAALLVSAWSSLLADSPLGLKPRKVVDRFVKKLEHDLFEVIPIYSELGHRLSKNCSISTTGPEGDKIILSYLKDFEKTPVFPEYLAFYRTRDPSILKYLLTFCLFGKKSYFENPQLDAVALRKWQVVEARLGSLELPPYLENIKVVMTWIFKDWVFDVFLPKHGGGAVSERGVNGVLAKNRTMTIPSPIRALYFWDRNGMLNNQTQNVGLPMGEDVIEDAVLDVARLKFVAKDYKSTRSICMEPAAYQWAQQGVRLVYERFLRSSVLKNHIDLKDQRVNQRFAEWGSKYSHLDTLDLSSASDCVSWMVIKYLFPSQVLKHLWATRTSKVELSKGRVQDIHKYAPMGSSLCFPVQTTLYAAVVMMVAMAKTAGRDWRQPGAFEGWDLDMLYQHTFSKSPVPRGDRRFYPFVCYGDDIITDNRLTSNTVEILTDLGFVVNDDKSFTGRDAYRESCGKHYFAGHDVTPWTFKPKAVKQKVSIATMVGLVDLTNGAGNEGYQNLRRTLLNFCMYYPIEGVRIRKDAGMNPILFTCNEEDSFALLCTNPRNTHLRKRIWTRGLNGLDSGSTSQRYQRDEVLRIVPAPERKYRLSKHHDNYFYTLWWNSKYDSSGSGDGESPVAVKADALGEGIGWEWIPA